MQVIVTPKAQKQYSHLPKAEQSKIKRKLTVLGENPLVGKKLSGEFSEIRSIKAWPYRIFYLIETKKNKIFIVTITHRQGAYK